MKYRIIIAIFILLLFAVAGSLFYFRNQVYYSMGTFEGNKSFEIKKGEGNTEIANRLEKEGLIAKKIYFYYYIKTRNLSDKIMPGVFLLSGKMTISEITHIITNPEEQFVKITFPEGYDARKMADRLKNNGFNGGEFLEIVENPGEMKKRYSYLSGENVKTLEGYLFPDTYYFKKDVETSDIIGRMLDIFDARLSAEMRAAAEKENRTIGEIVTMASIVEREVQTKDDMKIVAGIFWKRIAIGQKLQSDATLSYILNDKNDQHSGADLELDSPYNSYKFEGLPPTPISNPGLNALLAAVYPEDSPYLYFLTVSVDGVKKVIYSATFEEHVAARNKYGI